MLVFFLIMLREGVEAALIVGIIASYLKRTGRADWLPAIWVGILLACALSLFVGAALQVASAEFPQKMQEAFEALVGLVAVFILTSMVFWMRKMGRSMRSDLHASIDAALSERNQAVALIAMVFFAVAREGVEAVFFLLAIFQQSSGLSAPAGAVLGLAAAFVVGYGVYAGGLRLDLRRFFRWTGAFILLVAAGIVAAATRSLHEAGLWNHLQQTAFDLSRTLPADSPVGVVLAGLFGYQDAPSVSVVIAYVSFLVVTLALFLAPQSRAGQTHPSGQRGNAQ